jgi:hypothetical protein
LGETSKLIMQKEDKIMNASLIPLFANPLMQVQLDYDLENLIL